MAVELEAVAGRARRGGAIAAAVAALERSAELSRNPELKAERLLPWVGTSYIWSDPAGVLFVVRGGVAVIYRKDGRVAGAEVFEPDWQDDPLATMLVSGSPPPMPEWN